MKLSGVIIAKNEIDHIQETVSNLRRVCEEVVVVDSCSSDGTRQAAQQAGARVIEQEWLGYRDQRNFAQEQAEHNWVLTLDADERLSDELIEAILKWKEDRNSDDVKGVAFRRKTRFLGKWFRDNRFTCEWKIRLYDRRHSRWTGGRVHEKLSVDGATARIPHYIVHIPYDGISELYWRRAHYAELKARDYFEAGNRTNAAKIVFNIEFNFIKKYLFELKFLKGTAGLILAWLECNYTAIKYMKLYELQNMNKETGEQSNDAAEQLGNICNED